MLTSWYRCFPNCEPVSRLLRTKLADRWVRFHSLPGSKRYADNEADYVTILQRHNCILGELARDGETVVLLTTGYSDSAQPIRSETGLSEVELTELDPLAKPWRSLAMHESDSDYAAPTYWHVFASEHLWTPGHFNTLVRLIADNVLANVMIVAHDCRWLVHPYDGGMDVILESSEARNELKAKHPTWLSAREDRL